MKGGTEWVSHGGKSCPQIRSGSSVSTDGWKGCEGRTGSGLTGVTAGVLVNSSDSHFTPCTGTSVEVGAGQSHLC